MFPEGSTAGMEIDEDQFRKLPQDEQMVLIFRNSQKAANIMFHVRLQYAILTGIGLIVSFLARKVFGG